MRSLSVFALVCAGLVSGPAPADDKEKELTGTYTRKAEPLDLKIVFKKDKVMEYHVAAGEASCVLTAKYTRGEDGTINAEVTEFETKGDFPDKREKGYKFSFKWDLKDGKGILSELKGDNIGDEQKKSVEGEYQSKAD